MLVIGMAGTAKNTGKTTATATIMAHGDREGIRLAVTSIGYDGEAIDNVTGLPKPRLTFQPGMIVATAERCMRQLKGGVELLESTGFQTPLGEVQIGRLTKETLVVLAGPNKARDLQLLIEQLRKHGAELVIVDGALNRMAPMAVTNGMVVSTGAARHQEIDQLVKETVALHRLFAVAPARPEIASVITASGGVQVGAADASGIQQVPLTSLLVKGDSQLLWDAWRDNAWAYVPGVVNSGCLNELIRLGGSELHGKQLIIHDSVKLAVGQDPLALVESMAQMDQLGCRIYALKQLPVLALTVNPFYPAYRFQSQSYEEAFVDKELLLNSMQDALPVPVFDVMRDAGEGLFGVLRSTLDTAGKQQTD